MLAGEPYVGSDPYLTELRKQSQERAAKLALVRHEPAKYSAAICELLGSVGDDNAIMESPVFFDYGCNTHVGKRFQMNISCTILDCARVDIGDDVLFGPCVKIFTAEHPVDPAARLAGVESARPIKIGNNSMERINGAKFDELRKMLSGEPYFAGDPFLTESRKQSQERVAELATVRHEPEKYSAAIRELLGSVGDDNAII
ncbi:hypothetical protein GGH96_005099 [Coemansia sp. RSA 1972]|nr:hypothetical protein GGH96_005099 [Coemansia sp. RSA 1972]